MKKEITLVLKAHDNGVIYPLMVTIDYKSKKYPAPSRIWKWVRTHLEECGGNLSKATPLFLLDGHHNGWGFDYGIGFRIDKVFEL